MTLPPLPPPDVLWPDRYHGDERAYSDDAMRAYAEQAVAAERDRCINIVAMFGGSVEIEAAIRRAE